MDTDLQRAYESAFGDLVESLYTSLPDFFACVDTHRNAALIDQCTYTGPQTARIWA